MIPRSRPARSGRGHPPDRGALPPVLVACGGLVLEVTSGDAGWLDRARRRYATFAGDGEPALTIVHGGEGFPAGARRVFSRASAGFDAWFDSAARLATLPAAAGIGDLESLVRFLLPGLLGAGLAFHAALLSDGRRGYLCAGECGAGKSTLARLLPERALCDEIGVACCEADGFVAHSTPYWTGRTGHAPLAAVMLLCHGPAHEARRISRATATGRLARHLLWPSDDPAAMRRAFELLTELAATVPAFDLAFRPTVDVWDTIVGAGAG